MSNLDTEIKGTPASIRAVASWLRQDLKTGFDDFGDEVSRQRRDAAGDWQGETATAFASRGQTLVASADDGVRVTSKVATLVGDLADDLDTAQGEMQGVRRTARDGDLDVVGFIVQNPGDAPPGAGPSPGVDATPQEVSAWDQRNQAVIDHNAKVAVWNTCVDLANEAWARWQAALDAAASNWTEHDSTYVGMSGQYLSAGIQLELVRRATPHLAGEVDNLLTRAAELRAHADALVGPDGRVAPASRSQFYDLLDEADRLEASHPARAGALPNWELPKGLTRGLWVIDVATAGYGIYSDWEEEGPAQAITSNAVPAIASIAAGAASGAAIGGVVGSFVPIPGVGTAAGIVVGAGVGIVVGAFTSGAIDSLFDSGADTLGDWGSAVGDGFEEVGDQFSAIGEGVGDVFDSVF